MSARLLTLRAGQNCQFHEPRDAQRNSGDLHPLKLMSISRSISSRKIVNLHNKYLLPPKVGGQNALRPPTSKSGGDLSPCPPYDRRPWRYYIVFYLCKLWACVLPCRNKLILIDWLIDWAHHRNIEQDRCMLQSAERSPETLLSLLLGNVRFMHSCTHLRTIPERRRQTKVLGDQKRRLFSDFARHIFETFRLNVPVAIGLSLHEV